MGIILHMRTTYFIGILAILVMGASQATTLQIQSEDLSFRLEVPSGFHEYDYLKPHSDSRTRKYVEKNTIAAYNKGGDPDSNNYTGIFLFIERSSLSMLAGIGFNEAPDNSEILKELWKGVQINLYRNERIYNTKGDLLVTMTAAIPLKPEPIQIKLSGDIKDETEMRHLLQSVLNSLEGEASIYAHESWLKYGVIVLVIGFLGLIIKRKLI